MVTLNIYNRQRKIVITDTVFDAVRLALDCAHKKLDVRPSVQVDITFVSSDSIKRLNRDQRNINSATDVLSFPSIEWLNGESGRLDSIPRNQLDIDPETNNILLGDVVICAERAMQQAEEYGHSVERENAFLAIHGFLHLMGYDHVEAEEPMFSLQKEILSEAGIER